MSLKMKCKDCGNYTGPKELAPGRPGTSMVYHRGYCSKQGCWINQDADARSCKTACPKEGQTQLALNNESLCNSCENKKPYQSKTGNTYQGFKCKATGKTLKFLSLIKECKNHTPKGVGDSDQKPLNAPAPSQRTASNKRLDHLHFSEKIRTNKHRKTAFYGILTTNANMIP